MKYKNVAVVIVWKKIEIFFLIGNNQKCLPWGKLIQSEILQICWKKIFVSSRQPLILRKIWNIWKSELKSTVNVFPFNSSIDASHSFQFYRPGQNYTAPFSSNLTMELQKETERFMLVFPGMSIDQ